MGTTVKLVSGDKARPADVSKIPLILATCRDGDPGTVYTFDPGQNPQDVLGPGRATALALLALAAGARVVVSPAAPSYAALPSVTHTGTGPAISLSLTDGATGPFDSAELLITVRADGTSVDLSYDGTSTAETFPVPPELPAVLRGSVDISSAVPAMSGLTLIFTAPAAKTITFASSPATPEALCAAFDALAEAAPLAVRSRIYEAADGKKYFELYSTTAGTGAHITVDATSTGEGTLGLATTAKTGAAAVRTLDWLGVDLTFTAGTYKAGETYSAPIAGPRSSVGGYVAALDAAIADYATRPFGFACVAEDPADQATARSTYDALRAKAAAKLVDTNDPQCWDVMTATALHAPSATRSSNDAAIAAADAALLVAMSGATASPQNIVVGDCYLADLPALPGLHRRPALWNAVAHRLGLERIAGNAADGVASCSLRAADGVTWARDEARAATKLGGTSGPGFWCLKSTADGGAKWALAASRAGSLDRFRNPGTVAIGLAFARTILPTLQGWEGSWETDPESPKAASPELLEHRAGVLGELLKPVAFPGTEDAPSPANVSGGPKVTLSAPTIADDEQVSCIVEWNPLAVAGTVRLTMTATTVALTTAGG